MTFNLNPNPKPSNPKANFALVPGFCEIELYKTSNPNNNPNIRQLMLILILTITLPLWQMSVKKNMQQ